MQKTFKKKVLPKWMEHGVPNFGIGIGINSGAAVVGNLGSSHFMNYTVIGPSINLAQRLEAKAKAGEIWVHESLARIVDGKVPKPTRKEVNVKVKGVAESLTAYVYTDTQY
jgi:adenylate cyclase